MRQQNGTRGDRGRSAPSASELGWDDGLYEGDGRRTRDARAAGAARAEGGPGDGEGDGAGGARGGGRRTKRKRPSSLKRRIFRWFVLVTSLLILGTAGAGYLYYRHLNGNLGKDDLNLGDHKLDPSDPNADGQRPLNILLLGSDSRASKKNVDLGGSRADADRPPLADVQMLLHVSADRSNMSVVSIPRDTRVDIPKCTDKEDGKVYPETSDRINASLMNGGPGCTVATWEALTGVPLDHFMMIDFAGVVSMADAVGGVPVCVKDNIQDSKSGLKLEKGESVVQGEQALQWLRTRHGFGDGTDIGRAKAQHLYMSSMVRQLKAGTKLTDPGKLRNLAESATKALTVDHGLGSVKKLYDLGNDLKRVPTSRITMATMPWQYSSGGSFVEPKPGDAEKLFSMVRQDIALDGKDKKKPKSDKPDDPSNAADSARPKAEIPVRVMNGTGTAAQSPVSGRAGAVADQLNTDGFTQATADQTPKSQADTTISYATTEQRADAFALAESLGVPERLVKHSSAVDEVTLVVGADWRTGTAYPKASGDGDSGGEEAGGTDDNKAPDTADSLNGNDKTACMDVNPNNVW
ncbi:LytR family transcriptional regulator [Streptomyces armeniacus]|uniref:LytR family transcriptional regulator n=1 Tax=Streptomyces armeniacus TaxID=83291 RepID=A0A345XQI5_9ACTN|nr:LCP family protein [Streptomyces armeniacus]AXK33901.1 LytR family transcriptional regulator [Streptomyces armeniacus]